jgi:hypothetical protein
MMTLALIDQLGGWWNELNLAKQIFFGLGILAGGFALLLGFLAVIGLDQSEAVSAASVHDAGEGIFSTKPLTGFFLGFGWAGGIALDHGFSFGAALAIALVSGVGLTAVIILLIRVIIGMRSDGTARIDETVGTVGTVYITLPPGKATGGQVVVNFSGRQATYAAISGTEHPLASGTKVKVVAVVDSSTLLVEAL